MRYGVLSDVHGNAFALRAAVDRLTRVGVDGWLCAGDLVGYGPQPNECVALLAELGAIGVAGNHELLVLGRLPLDRAGRLARETTPWTRAALRADSRAYVAAPDQARRELAALHRTDPAARVLVLGHTHRPWLFHETAGTAPAADTTLPPAGRLLVNPGSVGQSRQREWVPRARFALLDLDRGEVRFFTEPYDVAGARAALRAQGLPGSGIHVPPGRLRAVPRRARALFRYARRRMEV